MTIASIVTLLLAGGGGEPVVLAQLTFRQQVIISVPARQAPALVYWKEKDGPKCISAGLLAGAQVTNNSVDLVLRTGERMRATLEKNCRALDYFSGFYLRAGADGRVCQDRDSIRVRSGGTCEIEKFRALVPVAQKQKKK